MPNKTNLKQQGVVILFAVLMVSVILTISLGVFNITYRQLVLSSMAKESEIAFAVADSARNCAQYWDSPGQDKFGYYENTPAGSSDWNFVAPTSNTLSCFGDPSIPVITSSGASISTSKFFAIIDIDGRQTCAMVKVEKHEITTGNERSTTITTSGYNMAGSGGGGCVPTNLNRAVERTIQTITAG
jgi:hypothetical protein